MVGGEPVHHGNKAPSIKRGGLVLLEAAFTAVLGSPWCNGNTHRFAICVLRVQFPSAAPQHYNIT